MSPRSWSTVMKTMSFGAAIAEADSGAPSAVAVARMQLPEASARRKAAVSRIGKTVCVGRVCTIL
jgi:hypothetical protein